METIVVVAIIIADVMLEFNLVEIHFFFLFFLYIELSLPRKTNSFSLTTIHPWDYVA